MKKVLRSLVLSILIVLSTTVLVHAKYVEEYKCINTRQNKWYTAKYADVKYDESTEDYSCTYYRYKIKVPENHYLKIYSKKEQYGIMTMYRKLKTNSENETINITYSGSPKTYIGVLPERTYYLVCNTGEVFKYKLIKYTNKANYKSSKALSLKAGKKTTIVQSRGHNYDRWYRIKVTKKKKITIWGTADFDVYDVDHCHVPVEMTDASSYDMAKYTSYRKLKPGTYYIRINSDDPNYSDPYYGSVKTIWWK